MVALTCELSAGGMEGHKHTDRSPDLTGQTAYPVDELHIQKDFKN